MSAGRLTVATGPAFNASLRRRHQGVQRSPNRVLRAVGFGDSDFGKPILGIANGYNTITPCNVGLNDLSKRAEEAAGQAGGVAECSDHHRGDGISLGTEGMIPW